MRAPLAVVLAALTGGILALVLLAIGNRMPAGDDDEIHGGHV